MVSQVLLFSQPRSACHLLEKMLSQQENATYLKHPFVLAYPVQVKMLSEESVKSGIPGDLQTKLATEVQKGVEQWQHSLDEAQSQGKLLFIHTHPHFALPPEGVHQLLKTDGEGDWKGKNFTGVPDELLLRPGTVPIFTTRHPALVLPSLYRLTKNLGTVGTSSNAKVVTNMAWNRDLYEWYASHGVQPIVVDSDDFAGSDHKNVVRHLCVSSGLDPDQALFQWAPATKEERDQMIPNYAEIQRTLINSGGVQPGPTAASVDLSKVETSLREEFGPDDSAFLMGRIEEAMPHYNFLRERRLVPPAKS